MFEKKRLTPQQAAQQIKQYCAYQERCHAEVKDRLYSFGLTTTEVETILSNLVEENYLSEERFAQSFARGKFRMKHWGRVKIRYELKQRQVSEYCIKKGMKEIDEDEYIATLAKLGEEKWKGLKGEKNQFTKKRRLTDYLLQKGYERDLITQLIKESLTS